MVHLAPRSAKPAASMITNPNGKYIQFHLTFRSLVTHPIIYLATGQRGDMHIYSMNRRMITFINIGAVVIS